MNKDKGSTLVIQPTKASLFGRKSNLKTIDSK